MTHLLRTLARAAAIAALGATPLVHAATAASAPARAASAAPAHAATPAAAPIDAEKQKLINQVVDLLPPETTAVMMVQRPAAAAMEQSRVALEQHQLSP